MDSKTFERQSAISALRTTLANQKYRPEVKSYLEYQAKYYAWVQDSADVTTNQPAIVQCVACIIDDANFREELLRVLPDLTRLCHIADACSQVQSLNEARQQLLGGRELHLFEDGTIGLKSKATVEDSTGTDVKDSTKIDVGEPPPLPQVS